MSTLKTAYSFSKYIPVRKSLRLYAMKTHRGVSDITAANVGLQPAVVLRPDGDNDTSVIRGPATMKAGWLDPNGAVKHAAACEKSLIFGV